MTLRKEKNLPLVTTGIIFIGSITMWIVHDLVFSVFRLAVSVVIVITVTQNVCASRYNTRPYAYF